MWFWILLLPVFVYAIGTIYEKYARGRVVNKKTGQSIPGPSIWTFWWSILFAEKAFNFHLADWMQDVEIFSLFIAHIQFIEVATPELAKKFLIDDENFIKVPSGFGENLDHFIGTQQVVVANGADWKRHRSVVDKGFQDVSLYLKIFQEKAKITTDLVGGKTIDDFGDFVQKMALDVLGKTLFGHEFNSLSGTEDVDLQSYNYLLHNLTSGAGTIYQILFSTLRWLPGNQRIRHELKMFDEMFDRLVVKSQKKLQDESNREPYSMMDLLVEAMQGPEKLLSAKEVRDDFGVFFLAGHETTSSALTFGVYTLAFYEDLQEKVRSEIQEKMSGKEYKMENLKTLDYTMAFIKETMRRYPPIAIIPPKLSIKEVELGGYTIPAGSQVCVNIDTLHNSKKVYGDPENFRPERWLDEKNKIPLYGWIPFSQGPRICVGMNFSIVEQKIFLCELLLNYRVRFVNKKPIVADPAKGLLQGPLKNTVVFEKLK